MVEHTANTELLEKAIKAFHEATGIRLRAERLQRTNPRRQEVDARVRLETPDREERFAVEVKRWLNQHTLGLAVERLTRHPEKGLLVTEYVNPNMAERLKRMNVPFLDTVGNAYFNAPPLFIYIKGQKPPLRTPEERPTRAFEPTGLKVVFALLCRQDLADAPYRTIAEMTKVARGTVGWVLADLKKHGHLLEMGKRGRKLVQKQRLLERWVAAYPARLRPELMVGKYAAPDPHWWEQAQIKGFGAYWGAEIAAARLTQYLKPQVVTIYVRDLPGRLLAAHQLRKDVRGNIEVLKAFWNIDCDWVDREIVHPLLAYADLLATGDARNLETAKRLYDDHIAGLVRED